MTQSTFGSYVLGLAGLSLLRRWYGEDATEQRNQLVELASGFDSNGLLQFSFATPEVDAVVGYDQWAATYDGDNPMIAAEQQAVLPRIAELFEPGMAALDAGCGTGRHAAAMVDLGYDVVGTDLTPAMLEVARGKVPAADFRVGPFEDLPVQDGSVDLIVSALAVCHAPDLDIVFSEFARVLRPGGRVIISDPHPVAEHLGGQAFFSGEGSDMPWVRNRAHPISTYVGAMIDNGFRLDALQELPYTEEVLAGHVVSTLFPEIIADAVLDLPFVVVFEASVA